ncbi:hypothetical protein PHMEG_00035621 [Phytophthora megakarya]|uniref:Uncharacterized protein n=1 Tax=Phytophthora megakarya TaxID=4795 RepID=A0A225UNS3_9STRA|nr:hypothetical protein PHMEG_00035621 [Phytophthora megakarya]
MSAELGMARELDLSCYDLGAPKLVTIDHWNRFCTEYGKDLSNAAISTDITAFFEFLRRDRVGLDFLKFPSFRPRYLDPGAYLVHAAQDLVEHCFTLVVSPPKDKFIKTLEVYGIFAIMLNALKASKKGKSKTAKNRA